MVSKAKFVKEFADLADRAGIDRTCRVDFPAYMSRRLAETGRSYAEVDPYALHFNFAVEILELPYAHRRGLLMHEIGHCLCPEGSEEEADRAAEEAFGERISYDRRWPGKGLQCVRPAVLQGLAVGMSPEDFDQEELQKGIEVEYEHTNDFCAAQFIAMDHLVEDPDYYRKLATLHLNPSDYELKTHADPKMNEWTVLAYWLPPGMRSKQLVGKAEFGGEYKRTRDEDVWGGYREELIGLKGWNVEVAPEHRRKGIARAMYARAEEEWGLPILPGDFQTEAGEGFLAQRNPPESRTYGGQTFTIGEGVYPPGSRDFHIVHGFTPRAIRIQSPISGHTMTVAPEDLRKA